MLPTSKILQPRKYSPHSPLIPPQFSPNIPQIPNRASLPAGLSPAQNKPSPVDALVDRKPTPQKPQLQKTPNPKPTPPVPNPPFCKTNPVRSTPSSTESRHHKNPNCKTNPSVT